MFLGLHPNNAKLLGLALLAISVQTLALFYFARRDSNVGAWAYAVYVVTLAASYYLYYRLAQTDNAAA